MQKILLCAFLVLATKLQSSTRTKYCFEFLNIYFLAKVSLLGWCVLYSIEYFIFIFIFFFNKMTNECRRTLAMECAKPLFDNFGTYYIEQVRIVIAIIVVKENTTMSLSFLAGNFWCFTAGDQHVSCQWRIKFDRCKSKFKFKLYSMLTDEDNNYCVSILFVGWENRMHYQQ